MLFALFTVRKRLVVFSGDVLCRCRCTMLMWGVFCVHWCSLLSWASNCSRELSVFLQLGESFWMM